eukprot:CAMPEP_0172034292 /NCGR_PEP_ID=MMETSP1041-20130122/20930_1 /TAXON_ID=464988 /ORGANISM="Hemiselmis andersenii, Strain CCMP439" /LENGTH=145 /DNA_ID=CAMNT_0012691199 /DNA_START=86 /DNA_END=523 /DNA_ORIENTATION=+
MPLPIYQAVDLAPHLDRLGHVEGAAVCVDCVLVAHCKRSDKLNPELRGAESLHTQVAKSALPVRIPPPVLWVPFPSGVRIHSWARASRVDPLAIPAPRQPPALYPRKVARRLVIAAPAVVSASKRLVRAHPASVHLSAAPNTIVA